MVYIMTGRYHLCVLFTKQNKCNYWNFKVSPTKKSSPWQASILLSLDAKQKYLKTNWEMHNAIIVIIWQKKVCCIKSDQWMNLRWGITLRRKLRRCVTWVNFVHSWKPTIWIWITEGQRPVQGNSLASKNA